MRYRLSYRIVNTIDLNKFELVMTLGQGAFGELFLYLSLYIHIVLLYILGRVLLVVLEPEKIEYALKVLDKSKIVEYNQIEHVQSEIRILNAIKHPNIIRMHSLFKDNSYIYVLMEYVNTYRKYKNCLLNIHVKVRGGDLFGYIKKLKAFQEHITLFFAAQIVLV
jgi:serine/threonine protein kinase